MEPRQVHSIRDDARYAELFGRVGRSRAVAIVSGYVKYPENSAPRVCRMAIRYLSLCLLLLTISDEGKPALAAGDA
jgi:hypothetical protein